MISKKSKNKHTIIVINCIFFIVIVFESKAGLEPAIIPIDTCFLLYVSIYDIVYCFLIASSTSCLL